MKEKIVVYDNVTKKEKIVEIELSQEEVEAREKQNQITINKELVQELKTYLSNTDYVIVKMYETVVQGGSIIEMLKEYKEVMEKRKEAREKINELED